jgi:hypothetical protein
MRGSWLTAIARRLLTEYSFTHIAAPAIADMQFEQRSRIFDRLRLMASIVRALWMDVCGDMRVLTTPTVRGVASRVLGVYVLLVVLKSVERFTIGIRLHTPDMGAGAFRKVPLPPWGDGLEPILAGFLVVGALSAAAYATLPAVFMLVRRRVPWRAVLFVVIGTASMTYAGAGWANAVREREDLYKVAAIQRDTHYGGVSGPLAAIVRDNVLPGREAYARHHGDIFREQRNWTQLASALQVFVFALIGVTLARARGIRAFVLFAGIIAARTVLAFALPWIDLILWPVGSGRPPAAIQQLPAFLLLPLVTLAFLGFDLVVARRRRVAA